MKRVAAWFGAWPTSAKFALLAAIGFVVFAFLNDTTTTIHLGFGRVETPHYVALLVAAAFGFLPGLAVGHWFARREARRRAAADESNSTKVIAAP